MTLQPLLKETGVFMKNYRKVVKFLEACVILSVIGAISECGTTSEGPDNSKTPTTVITPSINFTDPADGDTGVQLNKIICVSFNEDIDTPSKTFIIENNSKTVSGTVYISKGVVFFTPESTLAPNTKYTVQIGPIHDLAGNEMEGVVTWTFTTGSFRDTTIPQVISLYPRQADTGVALNANPTAIFSETMDSASVTVMTFTLKQDTTRISGSVALSGVTAVFIPETDLSPHTVYTAEISGDTKDLAGNPLRNSVSWTFTTGIKP
jgi:hypothetical protein